MPLTKEQLLITRVMCVGGKEGEPNDTSGDFITGDILTQTVKSVHKWHSSKLKHSVYLDPYFVEIFPHLFRPMPWWEGRQPEDMPEYVSHDGGSSHTFHKVLRWEKREKSDNWRWYAENGDCGNFAIWTYEYQYQPASESDYLEYQKLKHNDTTGVCKE